VVRRVLRSRLLESKAHAALRWSVHHITATINIYLAITIMSRCRACKVYQVWQVLTGSRATCFTCKAQQFIEKLEIGMFWLRYVYVQ
jgi:hypothetical protein